MVDVARDDRPTSRNLAAHELGIDALPGRDERHLRRDLASAGVVQLGDRAPGPRPQHRSAPAVPHLLARRAATTGTPPVVAGPDAAALDRLDVAARHDPRVPQRLEADARVAP